MPDQSSRTQSESSRAQISHHMPIDKILAQLKKRGIKDVTSQLNLSECSEFPISNGGYGDVYRGELQNGRNVALKRLRIVAGTDNDEAENRKQIARAVHEIYAWSKCKHPNVMELIGFAQYRSCLVMVSPWMDNGDLTRFLSRSENSSVDVYHMCAQIADGVAHLHSEGTVHGDIKGVNILMSDKHVPKLADFGSASLSNYTLDLTDNARNGRSATVRYAPPEIIKEESGPTMEGDIYSLGMTILEAITRSPPYGDLGIFKIFSKVSNKEHPPKPEAAMPENKEDAEVLWCLLKQCWEYDPASRPAASDVAAKLRGIQSTIDRKMSKSQILRRLDLHGCEDMTKILRGADPQPVDDYSDGSTCYDIFRDDQLAFRCSAPNQLPGQRRSRQDLAHELFVWSQCEHPNILRLLGAIRLQGKIAMVSDWMEMGTLDSYMKQEDVDRCQMCWQLADAVAHLHSKKIVHGDIKMSNILVSTQSHVQLFGFSYARMYEYNDLRFSGLQARTVPSPAWVAPENKDGGSYVATYEADVYALGKTILEIILCDQPGYKKFGPSPNAPRLPKRPERYLPRDNESANRLWSLLRRCWSRSPEDRPKVSNVRNVLKKITDEGLWGLVSESEEEETTDSEEESSEDETGSD